jgi:sugar phosphate permease
MTFALAGVCGVAMTAILYFVIPRPPHWEQVRRQAYFKKDSTHNFLSGLKVVLSNKQTWIIGFIAFALFMPLSVFGDLWGVDYIQTVTGAKKNVAAGAVSMLYLGWLIGGPVWGMVSDSFECRRIPLLIALFMTAVTTIVLLLFPYISMPYVYALLLCLGLASSVQVVCFVANIEVNPFFARGSALAVTNMIVMLIGGIFQWVVGLILNAIGHPDLDSGVHYLYTGTDYRVAMSVLPVMAIVALFIGFFMKESYSEHHSDLPPH